jgi:hypothetical protein
LTLDQCGERCGNVSATRIKSWIVNGLSTRLGRLKLKARNYGRGVGWRVSVANLNAFVESLSRSKLPRDHDPLTVVDPGDERFETSRERQEQKREDAELIAKMQRSGEMSPDHKLPTRRLTGTR